MIGKKGSVWLGAFIVLIVFLIIGAITDSQDKECKQDSECNENNYCGSDFKCHEFKVIEKTIVQIDFTKPVIVFALAAIIIALLFKLIK